MSFRERGSDRVAVNLRRKADRAGDLLPLWPVVGDEVASAMRRQFASEGLYGGRPWAPLDPDYVSWKVSSGYSSQILVANGFMRSTLVSRPMAIENYGRTEAVFGSDVHYLKYHQTGTRHMPQRKVLFWFPPLKKAVTYRVRRYIGTGLR